MKIGKSIVFEVENLKIMVKTLKKIRFQLKYGHIRGKNNEKCLNGYIVAKLLQKKPKATLTKLCSNKGLIIMNITGKFHLGLQCSSCFMFKL